MDSAPPPAATARSARGDRRGSGSAKRQRARFINVRLTDGEHAAMTAAAERAGLSVAAFMRHQCLCTPGPRAVRRPPVERAALAQLLAQVSKCGSNLNQIARALNMGQAPPAEMAEAIAAFRQACASITDALGVRAP